MLVFITKINIFLVFTPSAFHPEIKGSEDERKKWKHQFFSFISLSHTEHGGAHGSNTVYSVIHGLTGTSI